MAHLAPGDTCDCTRPATVIRANEKICARCIALEGASAVSRHRKLTSGHARESSQLHLTDRNQYRREDLSGFTAALIERPDEIIVIGFGTYRLKLG